MAIHPNILHSHKRHWRGWLKLNNMIFYFWRLELMVHVALLNSDWVSGAQLTSLKPSLKISQLASLKPPNLNKLKGRFFFKDYIKMHIFDWRKFMSSPSSSSSSTRTALSPYLSHTFSSTNSLKHAAHKKGVSGWTWNRQDESCENVPFVI